MRRGTRSGKHKSDIYTSLNEVIPKNLRRILLDLEENPLWFAIGNYLVSIPVRENVHRLRLIDELSALTKEDYYKIRDALNDLEGKGYIYVKSTSKPDHFLTPSFAEAMRIRRKFESEVLNPILDELKSDPEFSECKDLERSMRRAIYSALV